MNKRKQLERALFFQGEPAYLYASCGDWDDYVEIVLPKGLEQKRCVQEGLSKMSGRAQEGNFDLHVDQGPPVTLCLMTVYVGRPQERGLPHVERLRSMLSFVADAWPALDMGNLLPEPPTAVKPIPVGTNDVGPTESTASMGFVNTEDAVGPGPDAGPAPEMEEAPILPGKPTAPDNAGATTFVSEAHLLNEAERWVARGKVHKAMRLVEELLRKNAHNGDAWGLSEQLKLLQSREKKRRRNPLNAQLHLEAGFSYLTLGCHEEALKALRQSCHLERDNYMAHLLLGVAAHSRGNTLDARQAYETAARLRPGERVPVDLLAALARGQPPPRLVEENPAHQGCLASLPWTDVEFPPALHPAIAQTEAVNN